MRYVADPVRGIVPAGQFYAEKYARQFAAQSGLSAPRVLRDTFDKPVQSMANGKWYTSKRGLAATHKASGNPHGQNFIELGNEQMPIVEHKTSEADLRNDIRSAMADVKSGNFPPVLALDD